MNDPNTDDLEAAKNGQEQHVQWHFSGEINYKKKKN